jgi:hypothetical protein
VSPAFSSGGVEHASLVEPSREALATPATTASDLISSSLLFKMEDSAMTSDEWLGIVRWLSEKDINWTADVAAKYGVALKRYEADRVQQALTKLIDVGAPLHLQSIHGQLRTRPSKWSRRLEETHVRLYPNGCASRHCDICRVAHR